MVENRPKGSAQLIQTMIIHNSSLDSELREELI